MRFVLIILCILGVACKKSQDEYYWGQLTATKDGSTWKAKPTAARNTEFKDRIDIVADVYNQQGFLREQIYFFELKRGTERQNLYRTGTFDNQMKAGAHYFTSTDDGDVGCDVYDVLAQDSLLNYIQLTEINPLTRILSGTFNVRFVIDRLPKCDPSARDTIVFNNGAFVTRTLKVN